jgi:hypothetical protein
MGPLDIHLDRLKARFNDAEVKPLQGNGTFITVPSVPLPPGWNKQTTAVHFFAPEGYPFAQPDCFWADDDLRLESGALPQASNVTNPPPGIPLSGLWFSWHLLKWNAGRDDLLSWLACIKDRFARAV